LVLREEGYEVETAASAGQTRMTNADLVLMDAHAPELSRAGAVVDLKLQLGTVAPCYLFASNAEDQLKQRAQQLGADGYVSTEWGFKRILSLVRFTVRRKSATPLPPPPHDAAFNGMNRILVLAEGEVKEFKSPKELVEDKKSFLYGMIEATGKSSMKHLIDIAKGQVDVFAAMQTLTKGMTVKTLGMSPVVERGDSVVNEKVKKQHGKKKSKSSKSSKKSSSKKEAKKSDVEEKKEEEKAEEEDEKVVALEEKKPSDAAVKTESSGKLVSARSSNSVLNRMLSRNDKPAEAKKIEEKKEETAVEDKSASSSGSSSGSSKS